MHHYKAKVDLDRVVTMIFHKLKEQLRDSSWGEFMDPCKDTWVEHTQTCDGVNTQQFLEVWTDTEADRWTLPVKVTIPFDFKKEEE